MTKRSGIRRGKPIVTDEWLWGKVAEQVEPLRQSHRRARADADDLNVKSVAGDAEQPSRPFQSVAAQTRQPAFNAPVGAVNARSIAPTSGKSPPPLAELDRKRTRKLATGRMHIEARIDLHGMRQAEAHAALRSFLRQAHARGLRTVLVITGKGGSRRERDDDDYMYAGGGEGVLKRALPHWLAAADLRGIVVGFGEAGVRHGGGGAYYVQVRRPRE